jgi:dTDP-4-dehydrorhamnose reductase
MLGARVEEELALADHWVQAFTRSDVDLSSIRGVKDVVSKGFDWIVNCAGIVKSRSDETIQMVLVNAAMPHLLEDFGARVLHVSTDCVFSGNKGSYTTQDDPDPVDLYGVTKLAGELHGPASITLRTSFIGWEDGTKRGLLEWLVRQTRVNGYINALWSGLSAREVARAIVKTVENADNLQRHDLYHLSGLVISKYTLLHVLSYHLKLNVEITPVYEPVNDRSLDGSSFNRDFDYKAPSWEEMAAELARERS